MLISHDFFASPIDLDEIKSRLSKTKDLCLPLEETVDLVDQLATFELGQFLLKNKGLNGYWTAYVILYGKNKKDIPPLEHWLISSAPILIATQERFALFQKAILKRIKPNSHIASLPCGLMEEILSLPLKSIKDITSTGIDLDEQSLQLAQENAKARGVINCNFVKRDAWDLQYNESFDLITSNGLNIYEPSSERLIALYREMAKALRPNGELIISYLANPEDKAKKPPLRAINPKEALKQKAIFQDIIQTKWRCYQSEESTRMQLQAAGLTVTEIIYDSQSLFPTVIAQKFS